MTRVSVIMPAYNGIKTIEKALTALQTQTFADLEIVVVDDQSTDGTYEFVQSLAARDPRIKLSRTPQNLGHGGASRTAMDLVTGDWVTILDTDDWCENDRVEAMARVAVDLHADMVIDNLQIFDHALGRIVKRTRYGSATPTKLMPEDIFRMDNPLRRDSIGYCKPMMRVQFLRDHKINYWGKYRDNEDFILLAEIMLCGARTFSIPEAYYIYRHRVSPTTRKISPTSHSADDTTTLIMHNCDELIDKYKATMSVRARETLLQRRRIFQIAHMAIKQRELFDQGRYVKAAALFFTYPSLWSYRAVGIVRRLGILVGAV